MPSNNFKELPGMKKGEGKGKGKPKNGKTHLTKWHMVAPVEQKSAEIDSKKNSHTCKPGFPCPERGFFPELNPLNTMRDPEHSQNRYNGKTGSGKGSGFDVGLVIGCLMLVLAVAAAVGYFYKTMRDTKLAKQQLANEQDNIHYYRRVDENENYCFVPIFFRCFCISQSFFFHYCYLCIVELIFVNLTCMMKIK